LKLCVVKTFIDIEELVGAATELERVLGELGKTLKEEQEEGASKTMMEKQVIALNNTVINFFKGTDCTQSRGIIFFHYVCKGGDHLATTCSRLNEPQPKCAKCGMPRRIKNCGIKCTFCASLGHSENKCWKKPKDGKSHSGTVNFLEVLLNDEEATMQQLNKLCGNGNFFSYT